MITDTYKKLSPDDDIAGYDSEGGPVYWSDIYNPKRVEHYLKHPLEVK
jgi:hypothetical protein